MVYTRLLPTGIGQQIHIRASSSDAPSLMPPPGSSSGRAHARIQQVSGFRVFLGSQENGPRAKHQPAILSYVATVHIFMYIRPENSSHVRQKRCRIGDPTTVLQSVYLLFCKRSPPTFRCRLCICRLPRKEESVNRFLARRRRRRWWVSARYSGSACWRV